MDRRRWMIRSLVVALFVALVAVLAFIALGGIGMLEAGEYERTTVTVTDENGTTLATVDARVADTLEKRIIGLSDTESIDDGEGMLFVHGSEGRHSYVMRDMSFPIDIVFIDGNGTVTTIHNAPLPPEGTNEAELTRYRGLGKYVLEVPYEYTNRTGIEVGDCLGIEGRWGSNYKCPGGSHVVSAEDATVARFG